MTDAEDPAQENAIIVDQIPEVQKGKIGEIAVILMTEEDDLALKTDPENITNHILEVEVEVVQIQ